LLRNQGTVERDRPSRATRAGQVFVMRSYEGRSRHVPASTGSLRATLRDTGDGFENHFAVAN